MKKRRKKLSLIFILPLIFLVSLVFFLYFLKFKEVVFEPENFSPYLKSYFQNKSLLEVFLGLKKIMTNFPEIIKITLQPNFFNQSLKVKIETAKIVSQICDLNKCLYLDIYSRIIQPKILEKNNFLKIQSYLEIKENTLLNPKLTNLLSLIFEYANWKPLVLKQIKIYSNFDLGVIDKENREFLFDPNRDLKEQIKKLHLFVVKDFKGSRIDLRIPKKIYYLPK